MRELFLRETGLLPMRTNHSAEILAEESVFRHTARKSELLLICRQIMSIS